MSHPLGRCIRDFMLHATVERGHSAHTLSAYKADLHAFQNFLADAFSCQDIEAVTAAHIEAFVQRLAKGTEEQKPLAVSSVRRKLASIKALFKFAVIEYDLAQNVAAEVPGPASPAPMPKPMAIHEVGLLLDAARDRDPQGIGLRDLALLELLYGTGARITEILSLDIDDLNLESRSLMLTGKGRKQRQAPLGGPAINAVAAYMTRLRPQLSAKGKGSPALFLNQRGERLTRQSAWNLVKSLVKSLGFDENISPHTLRHSFATHLLQSGAGVRHVQDLLGHAAVSTTERYTRVTVDSLREVYASSHPRAL